MERTIETFAHQGSSRANRLATIPNSIQSSNEPTEPANEERFTWNDSNCSSNKAAISHGRIDGGKFNDPLNSATFSAYVKRNRKISDQYD